MNALNGSTGWGWLTLRFGVGVDADARRLSVDLAGATPQRPKTQPPTFLVMPTFSLLEEQLEFEELIERASLLFIGSMLERR